MVQPLLASSGSGYGTSSLDQDASQLDQLAQHLKSAFNSQVCAVVYERSCPVCTSTKFDEDTTRELTVRSYLRLSLSGLAGPASKPASC